VPESPTPGSRPLTPFFSIEASWMQGPPVQPMAASEPLPSSKWRSRNGLTTPAETGVAVVEWNGYSLLAPAVHSGDRAFRNSTHGLS
jgi:hypothetical protein